MHCWPNNNQPLTQHNTTHTSLFVKMNPFAQQSEMDKMCGDFQLTRMQRFYGFGICFTVGFLVSFFSTFMLFGGNIGGFAVLYSIGNIVSLLATGFLTGFFAQFKKMFDATRLTATIVFLTTLILTLVSAFAFGIPVLTLLFCVIQYFALMWYSLSYIPFARDAVKGLIGIRS